jgi:hypothetical protein
MSPFPTPSDIQCWYPERWSEIIGNKAIVEKWKEFIQHGPCNTLFTGPSRTGKTRTISLGLCALACTNRTETLDPCGSCQACKVTHRAKAAFAGIYSKAFGNKYSFVQLDCERVSAEELENLHQMIELESSESIIYLDEVAALGRRNLERRLLKMVDESRAIWIASAIRLKRAEGPKKGQWIEQLSEEMLARFPMKLGTSYPHPDDLGPWIEGRCQAWNISIADKELTIRELINRTDRRVGILLHVFVAAATRPDRTISPELVSSFKFEAED